MGTVEWKPVQNREQAPALNWGMERGAEEPVKVTKKKPFLKSMKERHAPGSHGKRMFSKEGVVGSDRCFRSG